MPSRRERVISLLASVILCSCLACSVSFMAGSSTGGLGPKASEPSIRTASVYGAPTLASLFRVDASAKTNSSDASVKGSNSDGAGSTNSSDVKVKGVVSEGAGASKDDPAADEASEKDELRQLGAENAEGTRGNLLIGSIALIGLSALAITISAVVGITLLAPRLWRRRRDGSRGSAVGGTYEDGQKLAPSASLGTHDSISL